MKYRVEVDVSFVTEKDALDFISKMKEMKDKIEPALAAKTGADSTLIQPMSIKYHQCRHDEDPPQPCDGYVTVDVKG